MSNEQCQKKRGRIVIIALAVLLSAPSFSAQYTLQQAVSRAQAQDPWISGSLKRQESMEAMSVDAGSLPDPFVSIGVANLPIDSMDFSQEAMTQLKVGVNQLFPRGRSLALTREKYEKLSQVQPFAREDRHAHVALTVSQLWLEAYRFQATIALIEGDRFLFEHLVDIAQSNYTTASGRTRQQDVVRAQLELTRLDDRLTRLFQQQEMHLARLGEWISDPAIHLAKPIPSPSFISLLLPKLIDNDSAKQAALTHILSNHPLVKQLDQKMSAFNSSVDLAKQSYKPQWGVNASYAYRDDTPAGENRADFFSVGMTFDVPLFTGARQDKKVQSSIADLESVKTDRALVLRQLKARFETAQAQYLRLTERKSLFDTRLLKQMAEHVEASLLAYTHDDGDFYEVVRARIAQLNARIDALNIDIEIQKTIAQINYVHAGNRVTQTPNSAASMVEIAAGDTHE